MTRFVDVTDRNGRVTQIPADWMGTRLGKGYTLHKPKTKPEPEPATKTPAKTTPKRDAKKEA